MATTVTLVCAYCNLTFSRLKYKVYSKTGRYFCSRPCNQKWNSENLTRGEVLNCLTCNIRFFKRGSEIRKTKNHFCSSSCAATFNNSKTPKRKRKTKLCAECRADITYLTKQGANYSRVLCLDCYNPAPISTRTLRTLLTGSSTNWRSRVSDDARRVFQNSDKPKCCLVCKYDKHYDVCHIKAVSKFDLDSLVSEVNSLDNLVALCKNHHWEFDKGELNISEYL